MIVVYKYYEKKKKKKRLDLIETTTGVGIYHGRRFIIRHRTSSAGIIRHRTSSAGIIRNRTSSTGNSHFLVLFSIQGREIERGATRAKLQKEQKNDR